MTGIPGFCFTKVRDLTKGLSVKKHTGVAPGQYRTASDYARPLLPLQCE